MIATVPPSPRLDGERWSRLCETGEGCARVRSLSALAKQAFQQSKTVHQFAEETLLNTPDLAGRPITKSTLDTALDPWAMTLPGGEGSAGG